MKRINGVVLVAVLATACAHYEPAPVDLPGIVQRSLDDEMDVAGAQAELDHIQPNAVFDPGVLDLSSLLAIALVQRADVALAKANVATARATARAASAGPATTLALTTEYANDRTTNSPWLYGFSYDIPLDLGVQRDSRIARTQVAALISEIDYSEQVWQMRTTIKTALATRIGAERELDIATAALDIRRALLTAAERLFAEGQVGRLEVDRMRLDEARDERRVADVTGRLDSALAALSSAVGVAPGALSASRFVWRETTDPGDAQLDDGLAVALANRGDVLRSMLAYDDAETSLRAAVAAQYPGVHLTPGYTWERGLTKLPFSLALSLPPMDLNRGAIAVAEADRSAKGKAIEVTVALATQAYTSARTDYANASRSLRVAHQQLTASGEIADQTNRALAEGAISRLDQLLAQADLQSTRFEVLAATLALRAAEAALENALRHPLQNNTNGQEMSP